MTNWTRRGFIVATAATTAACGTAQVQSGAQIDQKVAISRQQLFQTVPGAQRLAQNAAGYLIIPDIVEGGFVVSGAYGEGALLVGEATIDYMSVAAAAIGLQMGAQQYSQALFFMTQEALADFRQTDGWELGVDAEAAVMEDGVAVGASTSTINRPVYQVIYGQKGLILGASLEGAKYNRLIR